MNARSRGTLEGLVIEALESDADQTMELGVLKTRVRDLARQYGSTEMDVREALLRLLSEEKVELTPERKVQLAP